MNSFQAETPLMIMDAHLAHQVCAAAAAAADVGGRYGRERSQECHTLSISTDTYIAQTISLMTMTGLCLAKMGRLEIHSNV